ncbi:MAG: hypothetical protein AAF804_12790 [Bacteroidota bacterium]
MTGIPASLWAQAPYTGGAGDGYDQAKLMLQASHRPAEEASFSPSPQPLPRGQTLTLSVPQANRISWRLLDLQGRTLMNWPIPMLAKSVYRLELGALPPGTYQLVGREKDLALPLRQLIILSP